MPARCLSFALAGLLLSCSPLLLTGCPSKGSPRKTKSPDSPQAQSLASQLETVRAPGNPEGKSDFTGALDALKGEEALALLCELGALEGTGPGPYTIHEEKLAPLSLEDLLILIRKVEKLALANLDDILLALNDRVLELDGFEGNVDLLSAAYVSMGDTYERSDFSQLYEAADPKTTVRVLQRIGVMDTAEVLDVESLRAKPAGLVLATVRNLGKGGEPYRKMILDIYHSSIRTGKPGDARRCALIMAGLSDELRTREDAEKMDCLRRMAERSDKSAAKAFLECIRYIVTTMGGAPVLREDAIRHLSKEVKNAFARCLRGDNILTSLEMQVVAGLEKE
ncbi:MAG: hypothetical protein ACYTHM_00600 [Planctomycetota bacterium]